MRFTLLQRYRLLACVFGLSLFPLFYFAYSTYAQAYSLLEFGIQSNQYQTILKKLIHALPQHQMLHHRLMKGENGLSEELNYLKSQISSYIAELTSTYPNTSLDDLAPNAAKDTSNHWERLNQYPLTQESNRHWHKQIIAQTQKIFGSMGAYYPSTEQSPSSYLILSTLIELPHLQSLIYQATFGIGEALLDQQFNSQTREELIAIIALLKLRLENLKDHIERTWHSRALPNSTLSDSFQEYYRVTEDLINALQQNLVDSQTPHLTSDELISLGNTAILPGLKLWNKANEDIHHLLLQKQSHLKFRFWLLTLLTLILAFATFLWGYAMCRKTVEQLKEVTHTVNQLADGQTSTRMIETGQEEYDQLGASFNRLAQRLDETLSQFHELLRGIHLLSEGDLSIRLQNTYQDSEFAHVVLAFNQMAQSYEAIIGHLQQLGFVLTSSASQLSAASKEQEVISVEQEATTREIAVAANEISSTSKEFVLTLNDISNSAEQTSLLATIGKQSLSNMESIMRQMVEASTNIAAKLAILNEKAGNITSVITAITKVADQTNLLSLNASIEAEKAGEYGRSFAVIAREIRRLADQTAISTLDIEKMINEINTAVSSSVMGVDDFTQDIRIGVEQAGKVSEQLALIIQQVQELIAKFKMVNEGMQAQSAGAEQINEAIGELSQTAQQTAQSNHQFHQTIEELNAAANQLRTFTNLKAPSSPLIQTLAPNANRRNS
ncbi:Methyl-accepting chemotaxis signalling domain-containing protein [Candidatus Protochlamydia naegleriophila]|uniref:Methyl-accepting chemotaxis signalling domain-containing protein n=1 Tax=Candidatus Protochlamydia naegleriophila TaxID=389348 RepID=A0A0U5J977_9BACT|nr:methyl-accepting chemotaxis protein [Candidatus Protochlamydia naegleriophila]CUI16344.1 Methyl-accepting chemotaxis signalling domain-containing protein [Candidatus Protochlamydia naegleriophila]